MKVLSADHLGLMATTRDALDGLRRLIPKLEAARHLNPELAVLAEAEQFAARYSNAFRIALKGRTFAPRPATDRNLPCWSGVVRPPLRTVAVAQSSISAANRVGALLDGMLAKHPDGAA
jgi:hypothetical protein